MERWIIISLLGLLGVGIIMPYLLASLELSYLSVASITTFLEVTGITTINKIINIKDEKIKKINEKSETETYLKEIESKKEHIKDTKKQKIIAQELVPVEGIDTSNLLYADLESLVSSYIVDEKIKSLQDQIATNLDINEKQRIKNEATIYEFILQDIREESGKSLNKVLKK